MFFTRERSLTTPQSGVGNLPNETRRAVAAADQGVDQLVITVHHSIVVNKGQTLCRIRLHAVQKATQTAQEKRNKQKGGAVLEKVQHVKALEGVHG